MLSIEEIKALSTPHWELEKLLREKGPGSDTKPLSTLSDIHQARLFLRMFYSIRSSTQPKPSLRPYKSSSIQIPVRDGTLLPARVYTPRRRQGGCPLLFVCHGGSYVLGELDGQDWLCELFVALGGVAVDVCYRLAPEFVFPTAVCDAFDSLVWTVRNAAGLHVDTGKGVVLAGESNGGDIALAVAHLYANEVGLGMELPRLTGLYMACPMVMDSDTVPERYREFFVSREQNRDGPVLTTGSIEFVETVYKPDKTSPLALPILFPDHSGLPKTYLQIAGMDPLRDGGLIYEDILRESGVEVKTDLYAGLPHCFWGPFIHAEFTKRHKADTAAGLAWLLASS
ncbi:alpha/beta-hydrolase [Echria macrotheca]|uniref:Alpha/beta-hydrolase n=1 Tax=Echria macrotheca TaxID=438768 RepID=A0AAJ0BNI3_9PEZI|nr:alpha/beta-hydrolase [Echria macrotheca]